MIAKNRTAGCTICDFLSSKDIDIIYQGRFVTAALNPRISPNLFRTAIIPVRHIGEGGVYGTSGPISMDEKNEFKYARRRVTDAIIKSAKETGNKLRVREGQPLIDYLERPSNHWSGDLLPQYESPAKFKDMIFPFYHEVMVEGVGYAPVIVASFPKEREDLVMKKELRIEITEALKKNLKLD
jgi:hypothetical protein